MRFFTSFRMTGTLKTFFRSFQKHKSKNQKGYDLIIKNETSEKVSF
jgi:hypothetical protein